MDERVRVAVEREMVVAATPEAVWEVIADVGRWPEFKPFIRAVTAPNPLGLGVKFTMRIAVKGPATPVPVTVLEWERPRRMAWTGGLPGLVMSTHGFDLAPAPGGTRLVSWEKFRGPLCGLMLVFVSEDDLIRLHDRWLAAVKTRAESRKMRGRALGGVNRKTTEKFGENALRIFSFLEDYDFMVTKAEEDTVVYESDKIKITFHYWAYGFELSEVFFFKEINDKYSFYEIQRCFSPDFVFNLSPNISRDDLNIEILESMASVAKNDFRELLAGNKEALERLVRETEEPRRQATLRNEQNNLRCKYGPTISRADRAWEQKDYEKALELYQEAVEGLNVTKKRRLDFLLKKLGKKSGQ